ncbi:MAG: hypothetical protein R3F43_11650 [bacterium]
MGGSLAGPPGAGERPPARRRAPSLLPVLPRLPSALVDALAREVAENPNGLAVLLGALRPGGAPSSSRPPCLHPTRSAGPTRS